MRLIVCGGRVGISRSLVEAVLDGLSRTWPKGTVVVHGNAEQTDRYSGAWAKDKGWEVDPMKIDNALDGDRDDAPKRRNSRMLAKGAEGVIGFPGGPGTRNMIEIADAKGLTIYDVEVCDRQTFKVWRWGKGRNEKATLIVAGDY